LQQAAIQAVAALDESFFRVRIERLTPAEKRYLRDGQTRSWAAPLGRHRRSAQTQGHRARATSTRCWVGCIMNTLCRLPLFDRVFADHKSPGIESAFRCE